MINEPQSNLGAPSLDKEIGRTQLLVELGGNQLPADDFTPELSHQSRYVQSGLHTANIEQPLRTNKLEGSDTGRYYLDEAL